MPAPPDFVVLSKAEIVSAARVLIGEVGVKAFTMRALGDRLRVTQGAAYRHLPSRDAILDEVVAATFASIDVPSEDVGDWGTRFQLAALRMYDAFAALPGLGTHALLQAEFPASARRFHVWMTEVLYSEGFDDFDVNRAMRVFSVVAISALGLDPGGAAHHVGALKGRRDDDAGERDAVERARVVLADALSLILDGMRAELGQGVTQVM
jgi:AcrR family transcriptional regulator